MLLNLRALLPELEPKPYQTHSLRTFWGMLMPWHSLAFGFYILSAIAVLGLTIAIWKRTETVPLALRFSSMLLATVLVAPHLTVYDLVILAPALLLLADWLIGENTKSNVKGVGLSLAPLLFLLYVLPLVGPFTRWTHLQPSVIAMFATLYLTWQLASRLAPEPIS
jgi:hypothetical protein